MLTYYELDLGLNHVVRKYSEPLEEHGNFLIAGKHVYKFGYKKIADIKFYRKGWFLFVSDFNVCPWAQNQKIILQ